MKFSIGDKVIIRPDLKENLREYDCKYHIVTDMLNYQNMEARITNVILGKRGCDTHSNSVYYIDIDGGMYYWCEELLLSYEDYVASKAASLEYHILHDELETLKRIIPDISKDITDPITIKFMRMVLNEDCKLHPEFYS